MSNLTNEQKLIMEKEKKRISENIEHITNRIVVFSGKGGVGKTTVSVNLAFGLQLKGFKTGILDADVTGPNVPKMLGIHGSPSTANDQLIPKDCNGVEVISVANLIPKDQPIIWRGPMRSKLINQFLGDVAWGELDFLLADLPPGTGDEIITIAQGMKPNLAIIVTTPQEVSLIDSARAVNLAKKMEIPQIGIIENMSGLMCPECGCEIDLFGSGGGRKQAEEFEVRFLGSLPINLETRKLADQGQPVVTVNQEADISVATMQAVNKIINLLTIPESVLESQ